MKIGIYGGTFDPPHIGHVRAFTSFIESFVFDKVYVIPANIPPHKQLKSKTSANDRLNMAKIAFEGLSENVEVSDLEIQRQGKSYTADTLKNFKENGCDDIYFLCGTDMFLTLDLWYNPEYIFSNCTIVFARREADAAISEEIKRKTQEYLDRFNAKIVFLDTDVLVASSTEIREAIAGGSYHFLSDGVTEYIKTNGLYIEG